MALAPPPSRWQAEEDFRMQEVQVPDARVPDGALDVNGLSARVVQAETANDAWKHVKTLVASDGRPVDLYDSLIQSGGDTIDPTPSGWPALLKPKTAIMSKMPSMVMQRYNACQTVCFCGVFPELSRAWASVDNALFLWRFDKWNDVPVEYNSEEQAICAVGLVKPRPGTFAEAIQHLLVICTTTEIVLLGVCCVPGSSGDPLEEISILPLPEYSISSDNVTMCSISSTPDGRVFLGGGDGHLYEIICNRFSGWRQRKILKKDHSLGISSYLPSFLPTLWQQASPLLEIVIDTERHILYTRSQTSTITAHSLGPDGQASSPQQVGQVQDLLTCTSYAQGGDIFKGKSPADRKGATILHLAVIPRSESQRLHLVAVTQDGRRVYFTTSSQSSFYSSGQQAPAPSTLRAVVCRKAPPTPASSRGGAATSRGLNLSNALYYQGMVLMAEGSPRDGRSKLLVTTRDTSIPPLTTSTTANSNGVAMREALGDLEKAIPGDCCAIQPVRPVDPIPLPATTHLSDELSSQVVTPPPRFVAISTAGTLEIERRRPVEVLEQILEDRDSTKMEQFFKSYGAAEASAMCFLLVTGSSSGVSGAVVQQAKAALGNATLTGLPQMRSDFRSENTAPNTGFDMGQAVPVAEPDWSDAHKGLCLYLSRVVQPIWEQKIVTKSRTNTRLNEESIPQETLEAYESRLRVIEGFLKEYQQRRRNVARANRSLAMYGGPTTTGRTYVEQSDGLPNGHSYPNKRPRLEEAIHHEDQRVGWLLGLAVRTAEACFLLHVLNEHHLARLASKLEDSVWEQLKGLTLRDLVCTSTGESVAAQLIAVLVNEHLTATGGVAEDLSVTLQGGCPSYFKEDDRLYYQASGLLQKAEQASSPRDRNSFVNQALQVMLKVPLACDLGKVVPQLLYLQGFSGCVELPVKKADALDPAHLASDPSSDGRAAREARYEGCYVHLVNVIKFLAQPSSASKTATDIEQEARLSSEVRAKGLQTILNETVKSHDGYLHKVLYGTLVDLKAYKSLLSMDNPRLEKYLKTEAGLPNRGVDLIVGPLSPSQVQHLELLAKLFIRRGDTLSASTAYDLLASRLSGLGDQAVTLEERQDAYQNAVLQAKASGHADRSAELVTRQQTLDLQQRLAMQLQAQLPSLKGAEKASLQDTIEELSVNPKDLAELYNDYACPLCQWALALEMVGLAKYNDPAYIRQLWDVYLRQAWDASRLESSGSPAREQASNALEACCASVERLGSQLFPNEAVFPIWHVAARLETMAFGLWPERGEACQVENRIVSAMLKACNMNQAAVFRVYDGLLSQRIREDSTEDLHLPNVRLSLLNSLLMVSRSLVAQIQDKQPGFFYNQLPPNVKREVNGLADACHMHASEAGRLSSANPDSAQSLQNEFSALASSLQNALGR